MCLDRRARRGDDQFGRARGDVMSEPEHLASGALAIRGGFVARCVNNAINGETSGALKGSISVTINDHPRRGAVQRKIIERGDCSTIGGEARGVFVNVGNKAKGGVVEATVEFFVDWGRSGHVGAQVSSCLNMV